MSKVLHAGSSGSARLMRRRGYVRPPQPSPPLRRGLGNKARQNSKQRCWQVSPKGQSQVPPVREPIFLVGAHRSGTTLLRLMLDSHPQLSFKFESEFLTRHIAADGRLPAVTDYQAILALDNIFQSL